jgi:hypothetical protein
MLGGAAEPSSRETPPRVALPITLLQRGAISRILLCNSQAREVLPDGNLTVRHRRNIHSTLGNTVTVPTHCSVLFQICQETVGLTDHESSV